jgi:hypothetical protein
VTVGREENRDATAEWRHGRVEAETERDERGGRADRPEHRHRE